MINFLETMDKLYNIPFQSNFKNFPKLEMSHY